MELPVRLAKYWLTAYPLIITDVRQCSVFRLCEETFRRSMQECQLLTEQRGSLFGQSLDQVLQHGA